MTPSPLTFDLDKWRKPLLFGLWAAIGTALFALIGELWLALTVAPPPPPPPPPQTPRQAVVMVLDTSGSMLGPPFEELKRAATAYVERQDLTRTRVGIVSFNSISRVESPLTNDLTSLRAAIGALQVDGVTRMDLGLSAALSVLPPAPSPGDRAAEADAEQRRVLLFTDGYPEDADWTMDVATPTVKVASDIRQTGTRLVAIGTAGADGEFLAKLTGDPSLVFSAGSGSYGEAFKRAETAINTPQGNTLVQSQTQENFNPRRELWRIAVWASLLGIGLSGALLLGQNRYSRGTFQMRDALGVGAGLVAGLLAGAVGQLIVMQAGDASVTVAFGRLLGWALAGALIGAGIAPFIPNLSLQRAGLGGFMGGLIGALGFMFLALVSSDSPGRVIGAAILGFAIGLMVVLAEVAFREAWLRVSYGPGDSFNVNLGARPITVGNDAKQCRIMAREVAPVEAKYLLEDGLAFLEEHNGTRHTLQAGDTRRFGNVEITLCSAEVSAASPAPAAVAAPTPVAPEPEAVVPASNVASIAPLASATLAPTPATSSTETGWYLQGLTRISLPEKGALTVGRANANDIQLTDSSVEAQHLKLTIGAKLLTVRDLGSKNGTYINGTRLEPNVASLLRNGDRLTIGKLHFILGRSVDL